MEQTLYFPCVALVREGLGRLGRDCGHMFHVLIYLGTQPYPKGREAMSTDGFVRLILPLHEVTFKTRALNPNTRSY